LIAWSTFLYAALLLVIVIALPGGIADLLDQRRRRKLPERRLIVPRPELVASLIARQTDGPALIVSGVRLSFGGVRAIDGLDLELRPGEAHGLIGPNGSGKTTTLNVVSGFYAPQQGEVRIGDAPLSGGPQTRAVLGIARTFQTPRAIGEASVLENVMIGGTIDGRASFAECALALPRHRREEATLRTQAERCLKIVGLEALADERADRLQHSELRFMEIARALMLCPAFLLLDEPAAGLSADEITRLGVLIKSTRAAGCGVLLVEHHVDLIFDICDRVTVLNLGRELAAGTPSEIRAHREVVSAYLGG
jgi:ABC-type branched-subunit amino acid transport system ATPase component